MVPQTNCRYSFLFSKFLVIGPVLVIDSLRRSATHPRDGLPPRDAPSRLVPMPVTRELDIRSELLWTICITSYFRPGFLNPKRNPKPEIVGYSNDSGRSTRNCDWCLCLFLDTAPDSFDIVFSQSIPNSYAAYCECHVVAKEGGHQTKTIAIPKFHKSHATGVHGGEVLLMLCNIYSPLNIIY